jgi:hypothetical protein
MLLLALTAIEVLQLVSGAEQRQQQQRLGYVYEELQENWRLDPYGRPIPSTHKTKTFEIGIRDGQRYRKLIARDGKPLSAAEQWQVEEDLKQSPPQQASTQLADLARTHQITIESNRIEAKSETKSHTFTFDPESHALLSQTTATPTNRMELEYLRLADGTHLPRRVEVRFAVGDIQGLQVSTFTNHRPR